MIYDNGYNNLLTKDPLFQDTPQSTIEKTVSSNLTSGELIGNLKMIDGFMQSGNFVTGSAGWKIDKDGNIEANDGNFRGDITGASGTFSGNLSAASGTLGAITIGTNAYHVDSNGNIWWGSATSYAAASVKISNAGLINLGSKMTLDGPNERQIINDGTSDRILLGYLAGKF